MEEIEIKMESSKLSQFWLKDEKKERVKEKVPRHSAPQHLPLRHFNVPHKYIQDKRTK